MLGRKLSDSSDEEGWSESSGAELEAGRNLYFTVECTLSLYTRVVARVCLYEAGGNRNTAGTDSLS